MGDTAEYFKEVEIYNKEKRRDAKHSGTAYLERHAIPFDSRNNGVHLIVEGSKGFIDYWPSTGKWIARTGIEKIKGFGARNLVTTIHENRI